MSDEKTGFTVRDRRHFDANGTSRADDAEERASESPAAPHAPRIASGVDFSSFIVSLAAQASLLMHGGNAPGEGATPVAPDLEAARHVISIMEMLDDKTQGRRTDEESRLLEGLLFQLRMEYVKQGERGAR